MRGFVTLFVGFINEKLTLVDLEGASVITIS